MLFSVIIPLYNKAPYVRKALQSVVNQTYKDYEIIVVNDGSTDRSLSIACKTLNKQPNVKILNQRNSGVSTARNHGFKAAEGEYICFLDADDWWEPTFLDEMAQLISEYPDAGIYGTCYNIINEKKHKTRRANNGLPADFEKGYINYCQLYADTLNMPLWTSAVCIPYNIFKKLHGFKRHLKLGEDFDLWIRIAISHKVAYLNRPLSNYNQDVDVAFRGTGHMHPPKNHFLWHMDYLQKEEVTNPDYKRLIDKLRVYDLMPYYISPRYHKRAKHELDKVDWAAQPEKVRKLYRTPLLLLWVRQRFLQVGAIGKQVLRWLHVT